MGLARGIFWRLSIALIPATLSLAQTPPGADAQSDKAVVAGRVVDGQGYCIPNVRVVLRAMDGTAFESRMSQCSDYSLELPAGTYSIEHTAPDMFIPIMRSAIRLEPGGRYTLDPALVPAGGLALNVTECKRLPGPPVKLEKFHPTHSPTGLDVVLRYAKRSGPAQNRAYAGPYLMLSYNFLAVTAKGISVDKQRWLAKAADDVTVEINGERLQAAGAEIDFASRIVKISRGGGTILRGF